MTGSDKDQIRAVKFSTPVYSGCEHSRVSLSADGCNRAVSCVQTVTRPLAFVVPLFIQSCFILCETQSSQLPGESTGERKEPEPGCSLPQESPGRQRLPCNFLINHKMSLWPPGSSGLRGRISSAAPRPGEWIAAGQRMTKRPHTVPFPAGPNPRPGPDLSDSHWLTSGCLGPRGPEKPPGKDRWKE